MKQSRKLMTNQIISYCWTLCTEAGLVIINYLIENSLNTVETTTGRIGSGPEADRVKYY